MKWFELILEYLKTILSTQMVAGVVCLVFFCFFQDDIKALILRIAKIRLPGGGELSTPQLEKQTKEEEPVVPDVSAQDTPDENIPTTLNKNELETIKALLGAEKARAYLWEYCYLNYHLVNSTQRVLDWLISTSIQSSLSLFDTFWLPVIPALSERKAIISVLESHHLIAIENGLITVTPKGHEYRKWRGEIPGTDS